MKKYIEIQEEISMPNEKIWNIESYPKSGFYVVTDDKNARWLVFISKMINPVPFGVLLDSDTPIIGMPEYSQLESNKLDSISSNTLLKAIAIAQDANLAKELIKD